MRRSLLRSPKAVIAIAFAVFVFLGVSALIARALSATSAERAKVLDVARAEARGDVDGVLKLTPECARDVGPADRTARRLTVNILVVNGNTQHLELSHHLRSAAGAVVAAVLEERGKLRRVGRDEVGKQVHLTPGG